MAGGGGEVGPAYRDRARERREQEARGGELPVEAGGGLVAGIGVATDVRQLGYAESKFLGGDLEHTHLVKGLDFALLDKVRRDLNEKDVAGPGGSGGSGTLLEPRFGSALARSVHRAVTEAPQESALSRAKLEPGRTVYRYTLQSGADAEEAAPPATVLLPALSRGPDLADLAEDGALLKRVGRVLGYLKVGGAPDANAKKLRKKKKVLEKLQALQRSALSASEAGNEEGEVPQGEEEDIFADDGPLSEERAAAPNALAGGGRSYFDRQEAEGAEEIDFGIYSKAGAQVPPAEARAAQGPEGDDATFAEYMAGEGEGAGRAGTQARARRPGKDGAPRDVGMGLKLHNEDELGHEVYAGFGGDYADSDDEGRPHKGGRSGGGEQDGEKSRKEMAQEKERSRNRKLASQLNRIKMKFEKDGRDHGAAFEKEALPALPSKKGRMGRAKRESEEPGPAPPGRHKRIKL